MAGNAPTRPKVSTRAQSALGATNNPGLDNIPLITQKRSQKPPREGTPERERRRRPNLGKHKERSHHARKSSNSNYTPTRTRQRSRSHSSDSHTRQTSHKYGYDLTTSDSSPERSPRRENWSGHKGVVTS
ncbi:hypothetical protein LIER_16274 [Lithospermum erythrorhizon]|uniref:Uncharacterized protein n=1 Tax=Lithospermum erythrorhizon TaxID=34254 RepID=A0AAV3Q6F6_LITER